MAFNVRALKREFEARKWASIIGDYPYVAVLQIVGGRAWGRTNMRARVLGPEKDSESVGARFASAKFAREGAGRTRFEGMAELFRGMPAAVVYGTELDEVVRVVKRARGCVDGALLVGGRFGQQIVGWRQWEEVLESEGEAAEWGRFLSAFGRPPGVMGVLDGSARGLYQAVEGAGGGQRLIRAVERISDGSTGS